MGVCSQTEVPADYYEYGRTGSVIDPLTDMDRTQEVHARRTTYKTVQPTRQSVYHEDIPQDYVEYGHGGIVDPLTNAQFVPVNKRYDDTAVPTNYFEHGVSGRVVDPLTVHATVAPVVVPVPVHHFRPSYVAPAPVCYQPAQAPVCGIPNCQTCQPQVCLQPQWRQSQYLPAPVSHYGIQSVHKVVV